MDFLDFATERLLAGPEVADENGRIEILSLAHGRSHDEFGLDAGGSGSAESYNRLLEFIHGGVVVDAVSA